MVWVGLRVSLGASENEKSLAVSTVVTELSLLLT